MSINLIKYIRLTCIAGSFLPGIAFGNYIFNPYFGADVGIKKIGIKPEYGKTLFKNKQPVGSIFVGMELCPNLDLEVVVEKSISNGKKSSSIKDGTRELGRPRPAALFDSEFKFSSLGVRLFYKFNFTDYEEFKPIIGIGIKKVKVKLTGNAKDPTTWETDRINLLNNNRKVVFTLSTGAEYMFNNNFGSRILFNFENTSGLNPSSNTSHIAKLKNSFGVNIAAIVKI